MSTNRHRMYRSQTGCCICRVKSSSSRFTSSIRYERDFQECFHVSNRAGDICNACVLLVKRWRNRVDQERHWDYVVDLRLNPGSRSILKRKKRQTKIENQTSESRKHGGLCSCEMCEGIRSVGNIVAKRRERKRREREEALMDNDGFYWRNDEEILLDWGNFYFRPNPERLFFENWILHIKKPILYLTLPSWGDKCIIPCGCGPVLIGRDNEIMLDASQMKWCRKPRCHIGDHPNDHDGSTGTRESYGDTGSDCATSPGSNSLDFE